MFANVIGAAVVAALIGVVVPGPSVYTHELLWVNIIALPVYVAAAVTVGIYWGTTKAVRQLRWTTTDQVPTAADRAAVLAMPWRLTWIQMVLWAIGLAVFTTLYGLHDSGFVPKVAFTTAFGGIVVCAISYLLSEFALRPLAAEALEAGPPIRKRMSGVTARTMLAWALGTGMPIAGLMIVATYTLARDDISSDRVAITILALGGIVLCFGVLLLLLISLSTVAPIRQVRRAMAEVESGQLDTSVSVFDGTELGELQSGFNRMAQGLREREHLRDLFGRHVGHAVAAEALTHDPDLGGSTREVAVFFVDLVGSTELATRLAPTEMVDLLNRVFTVVVDEVGRHGGFVNKFEGDAALAVFGAPVHLDDCAGEALAAARTIVSRLHAEVPEVDSGIGVSYGTVSRRRSRSSRQWRQYATRGPRPSSSTSIR